MIEVSPFVKLTSRSVNQRGFYMFELSSRQNIPPGRQLLTPKNTCFGVRSMAIRILIWLSIAGLGLTPLPGQIPTGAEIIDKMVSVLTPEASQATLEQIILNSKGDVRTFVLEMYSGGKGEQILMRYLKPTSVRGQTFLILNNGDDIWTYFPRTRRVRKLATHARKQKVQGSDFSFEDFSSEETWKEDYQTTNLGRENLDGSPCWKLEGQATTTNTSDYPKVLLWVLEASNYPVRIDYLDKDGAVEKSMRLNDIRNIDSYPTAMTVEMINHLEGTKTVMKTQSVTNAWIPPKDFFSERSLKN